MDFTIVLFLRFYLIARQPRATIQLCEQCDGFLLKKIRCGLSNWINSTTLRTKLLKTFCNELHSWTWRSSTAIKTTSPLPSFVSGITVGTQYLPYLWVLFVSDLPPPVLSVCKALLELIQKLKLFV